MVGPTGFFLARSTSFHILSSYLLPLFLCLISLMLFPYKVLRKTRLHEFHIFYSYAEWYFLFSLWESHEILETKLY